MRQRDGLVGGVGGFFQQRFVEVDARTGRARIDVYDEQTPETPTIAMQPPGATLRSMPCSTSSAP